MNIAVLTHSGKTIVRPDTTRAKTDEDIYLPEDVSKVEWVPVIFAKMSRPGKCIAAKFASRYYDAIGFGVLLYPSDYMDGSQEGFAEASCLDHTSVIPLPAYNKSTLERKGNVFSIEKDGKQLYSFISDGETFPDSAIETVSRRVLLRTGDFVAVELEERRTLSDRDRKSVCLRGSWCENETFNTKIIL